MRWIGRRCRAALRRLRRSTTSARCSGSLLLPLRACCPSRIAKARPALQAYAARGLPCRHTRRTCGRSGRAGCRGGRRPPLQRRARRPAQGAGHLEVWCRCGVACAWSAWGQSSATPAAGAVLAAAAPPPRAAATLAAAAAAACAARRGVLAPLPGPRLRQGAADGSCRPYAAAQPLQRPRRRCVASAGDWPLSGRPSAAPPGCTAHWDGRIGAASLGACWRASRAPARRTARLPPPARPPARASPAAAVLLVERAASMLTSRCCCCCCCLGAGAVGDRGAGKAAAGDGGGG